MLCSRAPQYYAAMLESDFDQVPHIVAFEKCLCVCIKKCFCVCIKYRTLKHHMS